MSGHKHTLSPELALLIEQNAYAKWLSNKAKAHSKRDLKRNNSKENVKDYKSAIHQAVLECRGFDSYTGEELAWSLISKYSNAESKLGRRNYKAKFALLPTVDHVGDGTGPASFKICGWRTNDAKHDLNYDEFLEVCRKVIAYHERVSA